MTTTTSFLVEDYLDNITNNNDGLNYININNNTYVQHSSIYIYFSSWFLRLTCTIIIILCPWANYKLINFFQTRPFYKESSSKWYIIFKAIFDTIYMLISMPIIFFLTFDIDIIHKNLFTCKLITYIHYLSDDLISNMLALLCIDRVIRITCGYNLRKRFSLTICIIAINFFVIINIHHLIRIQHRDGFCHKTYFGIGDYDFDIYYSVLYTLITWTVIFITSINLTVSVYCDRKKRIQLKKQQQQNVRKIFTNGNEIIGNYSDRLELIRSTDDWEDPISVTIEQNNTNNDNKIIVEREQQDNIDLQITVGVLITSAIFIGCNLPNFIIFVIKFVYNSNFTTMDSIFIYISLFPLLFAHTISYFIFNHLSAHIFPNNPS